MNADFFEALVPRWLPGSPSAWNVAATVAEGASAGLLARSSTARAGGYAALVTLLVVWVANIDHVRRGGIPGTSGWLATPAAAWLRAPLQIPLLWVAWRIANRAGEEAPAG